jgi:hypothetical protein
MVDDSIARQMMNTQSVLDDVVYSVISNFSSRLVEKFPNLRKDIRNIVDEFTEENEMGRVPVRKRPEPRKQMKKTKNSDFESVMETVVERTRRMTKESIKWEDCDIIENIPDDMRGYVFSEDPLLKLGKNSALLADKDDGRISAICIFDNKFNMRHITKKEANRFKDLGLNVYENSIGN